MTSNGAAPAGQSGRGRPSERTCDVLVVGSGPSGSAAAYWLASRGVDVVVVDKKHFPREKTCGDGLTPRAVRQLADMGLDGTLKSSHHQYSGLRAVGFHRSLEMPWPDHPEFPSYGYTVTRYDLDALVAGNAEKAGAELWQGAEAVAPLEREGGGAGGAVVTDHERGTTTRVQARYTVVADGSLSRFGRALGTSRVRSWPQGMALRGYFTSPRHDDEFIESHLDIRDAAGAVVPGYGWIFPMGDGRVNVGVGILSTTERWKGVNTSTLFEKFVEYAPKSWCLSPTSSLGPPTGGRLPMGLAVGPRVGPDWLLVGDAAGSINPFNGEGIAYGYETGRFAAETVGAALQAGDDGRLADYEARLQAEYGRYYAIARAFVRLISEPRLMRACVSSGMHVQVVMPWLLRIMANLMRPGTAGPPEALYRLATRAAESKGPVPSFP